MLTSHGLFSKPTNAGADFLSKIESLLDLIAHKKIPYLYDGTDYSVDTMFGSGGTELTSVYFYSLLTNHKIVERNNFCVTRINDIAPNNKEIKAILTDTAKLFSLIKMETLSTYITDFDSTYNYCKGLQEQWNVQTEYENVTIELKNLFAELKLEILTYILFLSGKSWNTTFSIDNVSIDFIVNAVTEDLKAEENLQSLCAKAWLERIKISHEAEISRWQQCKPGNDLKPKQSEGP